MATGQTRELAPVVIGTGGPGASFLAYVLARHARHADTMWQIDDLARAVGLGGSHFNLWQRLDRLERFELVKSVDSTELLFCSGPPERDAMLST